MRGIFSVLVENKDGVLSQISGLFARRGFNIDSLAVGETERHDISSMTIVSTGDTRTIDQIVCRCPVRQEKQGINAVFVQVGFLQQKVGAAP